MHPAFINYSVLVTPTSRLASGRNDRLNHLDSEARDANPARHRDDTCLEIFSFRESIEAGVSAFQTCATTFVTDYER